MRESKREREKEGEALRARQTIKLIQKENKMNLRSQEKTTVPMKSK